MKWWTISLVLTLSCLFPDRAEALQRIPAWTGTVAQAYGNAADSLGKDTLISVDSPAAVDRIALLQDSISLLRDSISALTCTTNADTLTEKETRFQRHTRRYIGFWNALIPNKFTAQFAGSIGLYSLGFGWRYGKREQWETDVLWGYVPKKNHSENHQTLTFKERFIPWSINLSPSARWKFEPLTTGAFLNLTYGEGFWKKEPSKYTKGYYGFSTKVRYHIFVGQRWKYNIPRRLRRIHKSVAFYYELSVCDLYVVSAIPNKNVSLWDILSLSFGLSWDIF